MSARQWDVKANPYHSSIKKAYRKKALELHPDRNYGNVEETTKLFAEIQSAYEVLSDPQERAWYDSHRSAILQGQSEDSGQHFEHNVRVTTSEDIMKMFAKFNGRTDFSDSSSGFFTVLRNLFETLAREEALACDWEGLEHIDYPSFGHAQDDYEEVVRPFYAIWNGFATRKTFSWKDLYRYSDAPDRRVRRMMERENNSSRDDGIREFNETVRTLVQFVRKRDPRYIPNTQTEAERQKIIRDAAIAQSARSRAANQEKAAQQDHIPAWTQNNDPIEQVSSDEGEEEEVEEHFECVVCRKVFKSEKQFQAHERSKKHSKAVQQLQRAMRHENQTLDLESRHSSADLKTDLAKFETAEDIDSTTTKKSVQSEGLHMFDNPDSPASKPSSPAIPSDIVVEAFPAKEKTSALASDVYSTSSTDNDYPSRGQVEQRALGDGEVSYRGFSTPQSTVDEVSQQLDNSFLVENEGGSAPQPRIGKAKAKRAKKAAQQKAFPAAVEFECAACNAGFPSKTRLFNHIKDFGHAQPVSKTAKRGSGSKD